MPEKFTINQLSFTSIFTDTTLSLLMQTPVVQIPETGTRCAAPGTPGPRRMRLRLATGQATRSGTSPVAARFFGAPVEAANESSLFSVRPFPDAFAAELF